MSIDSNRFFRKKNDWSIIKDSLLQSYLVPYTTKILTTNKPLLYCDFFAGLGIFEDGSFGSPIIALQALQNSIEVSRNQSANVHAWFGDIQFADVLQENLAQHKSKYSDISFEVHDTPYEMAIPKWSIGKGGNTFLYLDPFGIRSLKMQELFTMQNVFNSTEILLNLNSFGFFREACRVYGTEIKDIEQLNEIEQFAQPEDLAEGQIESWLNDVAGGTYWQVIVQDYKRGLINGYQAERRFSEEFCQHFHEGYKYVLNLPLRTADANRPKYRMVHATNHPDGCILMYEQMSKQAEVWFRMRSGGQQSLFDQTVEGDLVEYKDIKEELTSFTRMYTRYVSVNEFLATYLTKRGVICKIAEIRSLLKELEKEGKVFIRRDPEFTETGKPSNFWTNSANKKVFIKGNASG